MDYEAVNGRDFASDGDHADQRETGAGHPQLIVPAITAPAMAGAVQLTPGPDGVIVLPAGVELDDITVRGRNLVIQTDDGRTYVIVDGAVFVPTLVIDGVTVPPLNLAVLLNSEDIQPAAGETQSSGNNFADPVGDIQDAYKIGDLLPYTEFGRSPEPNEEVLPGFINREPDAEIITVINETGAVNATAVVYEKGLPPQGGLPAGTGEIEDGIPDNDSDTTEATNGTIVFNSPDGVQLLTVNGTPVIVNGVAVSPLPTIDGQYGTITIVSVNVVTGEIGFNYTQHTNTLGQGIHDDFVVQVIDPQNDTATATLQVDIIDDEPIAVDDIDSVPSGSTAPATGNVITGDDVSGSPDGNTSDGISDTPGADGARVSFIDNANDAAAGVTVPAGGSAVIAGLYGTLTIFDTGDYYYVRSPNTPGGVQEVFTYTLLDGDESSDTATLTIDILNGVPTISGLTPAAEGGDVVVDEDDLPAGSDAAKESLTDTDTFTITSPDGVGSLVIDGHTVISNGVFTATSWTTPLGNTISITGYNAATGVVSYSYTLTANEAHANAAGENSLFESLAVRLADLDGQFVDDTLVARIIDDVPTAIDDVDSVASGSNGPATGNVITGSEVAVAEDANASDGNADVQGADGARVSFVDNSQNAAAGVSVGAGGFADIAGLYGSLRIWANGDYSYTRTPGQGSGQSEVFTYTLLDADGDSDTATLTITIANAPPVISNLTPKAQGGDVMVDEDDLPAGSDTSKESLTGNGTFTISAPDGVASLVIGGHQVITNGVFTADSWSTPLGNTISITGYNAGSGLVTYTYVLNAAETHPDAAGQNDLFEDFTVVLTDTDGEMDSDILTARIVDDVPTATDDTDAIAEGTTGPATGNVMTGSEVAVAEDANATDGNADVQGADGARVSFIDNSKDGAAGVAVADGSFADIAGLYGTLRIWSNGDYSYTRTPGMGGGESEEFTYTLLDGDGDTATAKLTISIGNAPPVIRGLTPEAQGGDVSVDEDDLPDGSQPPAKDSLTGNGDFTISSPDGVKSLVIDGHTVIANGVFTADSWTTPLGNTISITGYNAGTGVVSYTYTLLDNEAHANAAGENNLFESFAVVLTDNDDQTANDTLVARIVDDVPTATDDGIFTAAENLPLVIDALGNDTKGADWVNDVSGMLSFTQPPLGQGTVVYNGNGTFTFTPPNNGFSGQTSFTYTIVDGDGDQSTATVTVNVARDSVPNIGTPQNVTVDEDGFGSANLDGAPLQGSPAEIDSNELLINTGTVLVGFGADKPAAPLANIDFVNFTSLNGVLSTTNGAVNFTQPGGAGTAIVGSDGVNQVIVISFTAAADTANPGEVQYTYQVELKQPIVHSTTGTEASTALNGIQFQVTDSDGSVAPVPGQFNAIIFDDVPSLSVSDLPNSVVEGQTLNTGTWDQTIGADTAGATTKVVFNAVEYNLDTNINTGVGTLRVNSDGTWTFQSSNNLNNNPDPTVSFTVKVTDGDGDVAQDALTITITDGADPQATKNASIDVDEEGLNTANAVGTNPPSTSESGSDTVSFQAGSDNIVSVKFAADISGMTADVNGVAGADIVWTRDSDTQITGKIAGITAVTITLTPPALPITAGNSGSATVIVTLSDNFPHPDANGENVIDITGLGVVAADTDGDQAVATVAIHVKDDVPQNNSATLTRAVHEDALNDPLKAVGNNEGGKTTVASISAAALATLVNPGADAPLSFSFNGAIEGTDTQLDQNGVNILWHIVDATHVEGRAGANVVFTLNWNAGTQSYDFTLLDNIDHGTLLDDNGDAFSTSLSLANLFVAKDSDGDAVIIDAGATITIENDIPVQTTAASSVAVGEDTLTGGNPDAGDPKTLTANGSLAGLVNFGADGPGSFAFDLTGQTLPALTSGGLAIKYGVSGDGLTLIGYTGATSAQGQVFTVAFTNATTGAYTFTLLDRLDHLPNTPANNDDQNLTIQLANLVVVRDGDGDALRLSGGFSVLVEDDIPTLGTIQSQQASNDPAQTPAIGTLHLAPGADHVGSMVITANLTGITSGGHALTSAMTSANVLTAFYDADGSGTFNAGDTEVFTVTINPAAGTSGQYVFDLKAPLDGGVIETDVGGTTSFGSGPQPYQYVSQTDIAVDPLALISGWQTDATFDAAAWYAGSNTLPVTGVNLANVNGSTSGWGVDNNNFTTGELMRFDFGAFNDFDGAGPFNPPAPAVALPNISYAKFDMIGYGGSDTVQFVVHNTDGTTSHQTWTSADVTTGYLVSAGVGKTIAWIDAYVPGAGGGAKIDLAKVGVQSAVVDKTIPLTLTVVDGDGDTTATQPFTVHIQAGLTPFDPAPPIVLDLDGDGVEFVSRAAGITFDYHKDGHAEATAWAGHDDGILAVDLDGDGKITDASEFVFGGNGLTDLQGLAAMYDSNHDGVLDAADARFADFGVWKGDGSFQSLTDAGIASLNLTSDGQGYTAADGDVTVHGTTTYTRLDGTTGTAADASFATGDDSQLMDALLGTPSPSTSTDADASAVMGALAATVDTLTVDTLVDHFAGADSATAPTSTSDGGDLMALLNTSVSSTVDMVPPPMAMDSYDDHAALAAAAA